MVVSSIVIFTIIHSKIRTALLMYLMVRRLIASPFGAGTLAGPSGSRQPSALELEIATIQGKTFYETVKRSFST